MKAVNKQIEHMKKEDQTDAYVIAASKTLQSILTYIKTNIGDLCEDE